jgi:hypothetical protein
MKYVSNEADRRARVMEAKFADLPNSAGVLFVSVTAQPSEEGGGTEFHVRLGVVRELTEDTGKGLIRRVLEHELLGGLKIFSAVYRGIPGACRDGAPTTNPLKT